MPGSLSYNEKLTIHPPPVPKQRHRAPLKKRGAPEHSKMTTGRIVCTPFAKESRETKLRFVTVSLRIWPPKFRRSFSQNFFVVDSQTSFDHLESLFVR